MGGIIRHVGNLTSGTAFQDYSYLVFRKSQVIKVNQLARMYSHLPFASLLLVIGLLSLVSVEISNAHGRQDYDRLEKAAQLLRQGNSVAAEKELIDILRTSPRDPNALNLLGVIRAKQQQVVEAENLFLRAIRQSPRLSGAYINLGRLYMDLGKNDRAIWAYNQAVLLVPTNTDVHYQLAFLYADSSDFNKALAHLKNIPQDSWRPDEFYLSITSYLALNRRSEALDLVSKLRAETILDDSQAAALSSLLLRNNLLQEALGMLQGAIQKYPNSLQLQIELGVAYSQNKQWPLAEEHYLAALRIDSRSISALRGLAKAAQALGDPEKALSYLVHAKRIAPDDPVVLYEFAVTAFKMNLILDVLPVAERLYKENPGEPAYIHLLAVTKFRRDQKDEAEQLLRRYIQLRPKDPIGHYLLGITLYTIKRLSEANAEFEQSLRVGRDPDSEYMLGLIAQSEGHKAEAINWLKGIKPDCDCYAAAQTLLGTLYAEENDTDAARITLERATQLNPKDLRAHYQLGLIYSKLGEKEKAAEMFTISDRLRQEQRTEEVTTFKLIDPP